MVVKNLNGTQVVSSRGGKKFRLTGVYGEPDRVKRQETWSLIRTLANGNSLPWVLIGDMNNVLSREDKRGGRLYPQWLIQGFKDVVEDCALIDMNLVGYPFTWERGYGTDKWVEVRLDRALATEEFLNLFRGAKLSNIEVTTSDHCPILLDPGDYVAVHSVRPFRFENAWLREPMCRQIVEEA
ncbi:Endonuclease/exonuclease/phosphatase family protein [Heracleum sosnowskyi]|uniref:Endonuclease/exonuclease/phosphatase family protein n=1 Tax=Heracleum sosnowskyi TaxID=360622 RepID=A0AAD8MPW7_9APIA|nr:Endonuclease/exonuclease/phosphatase family protein [Heracleum sosnowskyi]